MALNVPGLRSKFPPTVIVPGGAVKTPELLIVKPPGRCSVLYPAKLWVVPFKRREFEVPVSPVNPVSAPVACMFICPVV